MTRKDYCAIAAELRLSRPNPPRPISDSHEYLTRGFALAVEAVARALQKDNPRFDAERFYSAVYDD